MTSSQPNSTIYIRNLDDKIKKEELRAQLYALFTPYGSILDVVAQKGVKKKGQAFVVFRDIAAATTAMRALDGEHFYQKKMRIEYARTPSHATLRIVDPNFVPPSLLGSATNTSSATGQANGKVTVSHAENDLRKRRREGGEVPDSTDKKRREDDEDDMEVEEDDEKVAKPKQEKPPSALLLCENLPVEVTDDMLAVLFQQYPGFNSTSVHPPKPKPGATSTASGAAMMRTAHVRYDTADQATVAKDALDDFQLKRGWKMQVDFA